MHFGASHTSKVLVPLAVPRSLLKFFLPAVSAHRCSIWAESYHPRIFSPLVAAYCFMAWSVMETKMSVRRNCPPLLIFKHTPKASKQPVQSATMDWFGYAIWTSGLKLIPFHMHTDFILFCFCSQLQFAMASKLDKPYPVQTVVYKSGHRTTVVCPVWI